MGRLLSLRVLGGHRRALWDPWEKRSAKMPGKVGAVRMGGESGRRIGSVSGKAKGWETFCQASSSPGPKGLRNHLKRGESRGKRCLGFRFIYLFLLMGETEPRASICSWSTLPTEPHPRFLFHFINYKRFQTDNDLTEGF